MDKIKLKVLGGVLYSSDPKRTRSYLMERDKNAIQFLTELPDGRTKLGVYHIDNIKQL